MEDNCKWLDVLLLVVIIVLVLFVEASWAQWVILIAAVILLICKFRGSSCKVSSQKTSKPKKKRK